MTSTKGSPPQDRFDTTRSWETNTKPSQILDLKALSIFWIADLLSAPICTNIHWWTTCVDCGCHQQDRRSPGARIHLAWHRGGELAELYFCINVSPHSLLSYVPYGSSCRQVLVFVFQVKPFTPREFTCEGMLERVDAYITHQVVQPHGGNLGF